MRFVLRILKGRSTSAEIKDWFNRTKQLGSALSTTRMALRICLWLVAVKYFAIQIQKYMDKEKLDSWRNYLYQSMLFIATLCDNRFYVHRIGALPIEGKNGPLRVSRTGVLATTTMYTMDIITEFLNCKDRAKGDLEKFKAELWAKKFFFLLKLSEYPMQVYYLQL